jgi:hypothetical protein
MNEFEEIIKSHRKYAEFAIFSNNALKNRNSLNINPFNNETNGDFLYLTNRKIERYSFLFDNLNEVEVYNNCNITMGYTALLICEKIKYFENNELKFSRLIERNSNEIDLNGKFCIFQNPLNKLFEYGHNDIVGVFSDFETAQSYCNILTNETPVLLTKIKAHINWH